MRRVKGADRRIWIFAGIVIASLGTAAVYVALAALGGGGSNGRAAGTKALRAQPRVVFQNVEGRAGDARYAHVALASLRDSSRPRVVTPLICERIYFAAGKGLCLASQHDLLQPGYDVTITGPDLKPRRTLKVAGSPSRARISPDGRYGATTGFVAGHSYSEDSFSTKTVVIDMRRGDVIADLEKDFTVTRDGKEIEERDFNFWGVTFARSPGLFYATLRTGGKTYLLEGNVGSRRARVLHENVECPSISPDNERMAYKKLIDGQWRLHVLDLATKEETALAETRPVDDQVEWLDDDSILYAYLADTYTVPADGSGSPQRFLAKALSPAVVRP